MSRFSKKTKTPVGFAAVLALFLGLILLILGFHVHFF